MTEDSKKTDRQFSFAAQKFMLTYKDHIPKADLITFLENTWKMKSKFIRCAHETGEDGYEHTHVVVDIGKRFQTKCPRKFDFDDKHPNIKILSTKSHFSNAVKYIAKEDKENLDLLVRPGGLATLFSRCKTNTDAINKCSKINEIPAALAAFAALTNAGNDYEPGDVKLLEWQQEIYDYIEGPINDRKILWICDIEGGKGKTWLTKLLISEKMAVGCCAPGGMYHFATMVDGWFKGGWDGRCCIFNFARSQEDHQIYVPLEAIKDGLLTSQKYSGRTMCFNCPHVIVFANWWPDPMKLSTDRWDFRELSDGRLNIKSLPEIVRLHEIKMSPTNVE